NVASLSLTASCVAREKDSVIGVFDVPIVDEEHHDLQALKLRSSLERIIFPTPFAVALHILWPRLKSHIVERTFPFNRETRIEIGDLTLIPHCPDKTVG